MLLTRVVSNLVVMFVLMTTVHGQPNGGQWLIQSVQGIWDVREGSRKTHTMGKFEILTAKNSIRCRALPCTLTYATEHGTRPFPLPQPPQARLDRWISVPPPTESPMGLRAAGLQAIIAKIGVLGGRRKSSPACTGELLLTAPACGELIDPVDFTLQWTARPSEAGKIFTLLVGGADSSERRRWNRIEVDAGQFRSTSLENYLTSLQLADRPTDVTIRLMRTESLDAIRLVKLASRADDAEYRRKLKASLLLPAPARQIVMLEQFLTMEMWSKAAEVSQELLRDAPDSVEIRKYAMIGFCRSGFADEIAKLRMRLKEEGVTGFCDSEGAQQ